MAELISAAGSIDVSLTLLVADIIHMPFPMPDLELASVIVFSQTSVERQIDVVRKIIAMRLSAGLAGKPHEFPRKACDFILKAFNLTAADTTRDLWMRNLAAHGTLYFSGERVTLVPSPVDFDGIRKLHIKRKQPSESLLVPNNGLTTCELNEARVHYNSLHDRYAKIREATKLAMTDQFTEALEATLRELGRDLKLQAPLRVRPHRERRQPKQPK